LRLAEQQGSPERRGYADCVERRWRVRSIMYADAEHIQPSGKDIPFYSESHIPYARSLRQQTSAYWGDTF